LEEIIVVDTDIIIDFFQGVHPQAETIASLIKNNSLAITTITAFELEAGIVGKKRLKAIDLLLSQSIILALDPLAAKESAKIYTYLKSKGKLVGNQDILIAGTCIVNKLPLFTRNKIHFKYIRGLVFFEIETS